MKDYTTRTTPNLTFDHPQFLDSVFYSVIRNATSNEFIDSFVELFAQEYYEISKNMDESGLQDSGAMRNVQKTRTLACLLINDRGELDLPTLSQAIDALKSHLYSIGPNRQNDSKRQEHILKVLESVKENKNLLRLIKRANRPLSNPRIDNIIKSTLQLDAKTSLNDMHVKQAILAAWLCYLRQNVGSCFATAPAIIVHDEQPELFLNDLLDLVNTGRMKRTFGGVEYSVPMSISWGAGDLKKPFFLYRENSARLQPIWKSEGLLRALSITQLINPQHALEVQQNEGKQLIQSLINEWENRPRSFFITTADEVLIRLLQKKHQITQQDLKDDENRPKGMLQTSLFVQLPHSTSTHFGKTNQVAQYLKELDEARKTFKALCDNALLKTWEFTLASFAETKPNFTRWNLYSSLGLGFDQPGGIGQCIYNIVKKKLEESNEAVKNFQGDYEQAYNHIKYLEGRLRQASTEKEIEWLKVEYRMKVNEFHLLEEMRNGHHNRAKLVASLFETLIDLYDKKFPEYFQEVYDADMHEVIVGPYDDSPAGFRLLYKYGRSNTAQWAMIYNHKEFIDALSNFFTMTESEIRNDPSVKGLEEDVAEIISAISRHVRTTEFLESAFDRMAEAHRSQPIKNPLQNLEKIEKKPWAYTSGGNMGNLVSCYYRREQTPTEVSRWVEDEMELLVFLTDIVKQMPQKNAQSVLNPPFHSMLMHSPTHAFIFKPYLDRFKEGISTEGFTYTHVRDKLVAPMQKFIRNIFLNEEMVSFLLNKLKMLVSEDAKIILDDAFSMTPGGMTPTEFHQYVLKTVSKESPTQEAFSGFSLSEEVDSILFQHLPLFPGYQLKEKLENLFNHLPEMNSNSFNRLMSTYHTMSNTYTTANVISSKVLQEVAKAVICKTFEKSSFPIDYHLEVALGCQKLEYALPSPIQFADTNWSQNEFGFVVNPGTGQLELWRLSYSGNEGYPMSNWKKWLNGSRQDLTWGVYTVPFEYNQG